MHKMDVIKEGNLSFLTTEDYIFLSELRKDVAIKAVHAIYANDINEAYAQQESILH